MAQSQRLGRPVRLQLVDVLRKHAVKVCVCEIVPLFRIISVPRLSPHLGELRAAGSWTSSGRACGPTTTCARCSAELSAWRS